MSRFSAASAAPFLTLITPLPFVLNVRLAGPRVDARSAPLLAKMLVPFHVKFGVPPKAPALLNCTLLNGRDGVPPPPPPLGGRIG